MLLLHLHTPIGLLRLEASEEALLKVHFEDDEVVASEETSTHPVLLQAREELERYFKGELFEFTVPLAFQGTVFQQRCWQQLCRIPYGVTQTYREQALHLDNLKAIRAVGTANGQNRIAILVPCHRVIGSDGSLTGYAGGLWRKKWLLEHEARYRVGGATQVSLF